MRSDISPDGYFPRSLEQELCRIDSLKIEKEALEGDSVEANEARINAICEETSELWKSFELARTSWLKEKEVFDRVKLARSAVEALESEAGFAERIGDLTRASEARFGRTPEARRELENAISDLEARKPTMNLRDQVTENDIFVMVASITGESVEALRREFNGR